MCVHPQPLTVTAASDAWPKVINISRHIKVGVHFTVAISTVLDNHKKVSFKIASIFEYSLISIGQKLVENATSEKFQEDIGDDFQTMWIVISAGIFRPF